jgi:Lar family restriction alleviation protein
MGTLKPCPFCGADSCREVKDRPGGEYHVECVNCGARGPWVVGRGRAPQEWNNRKGEGRLLGALKEIAKQPTTDELAAKGIDGGNYESAYEIMVSSARAAIDKAKGVR